MPGTIRLDELPSAEIKMEEITEDDKSQFVGELQDMFLKSVDVAKSIPTDYNKYEGDIQVYGSSEIIYVEDIL